MIISMTGFGKGNASSESYRVNVELSSVNNRFCEVYTRLPRFLLMYEGTIQNIVKNHALRGKINLSFTFEENGKLIGGAKADPEIIQNAIETLKEIQHIGNIKGEIQLSDILSVPDLFSSGIPSAEKTAQLWKLTQEALQNALTQLENMRKNEGNAIKKDFEQRLQDLKNGLSEIEALAPNRAKIAYEKLKERLNSLIEIEKVNHERLEFEIALLSDKIDIQEEITRLKSHFEVFEKALNAKEPSGKKLNFLIQELNREVNTIGSKANDAEITKQTILMKESIEQIREQVQNII